VEWEYLHEYWGHYPVALGGQRREVAQRGSLGDHLNARGGERWELVDMVAHWQWEERNHGLAYVAYPSQVVGYALTFKRPKE